MSRLETARKIEQDLLAIMTKDLDLGKSLAVAGDYVVLGQEYHLHASLASILILETTLRSQQQEVGLTVLGQLQQLFGLTISSLLRSGASKSLVNHLTHRFRKAKAVHHFYLGDVMTALLIFQDIDDLAPDQHAQDDPSIVMAEGRIRYALGRIDSALLLFFNVEETTLDTAYWLAARSARVQCLRVTGNFAAAKNLALETLARTESIDLQWELELTEAHRLGKLRSIISKTKKGQALRSGSRLLHLAFLAKAHTDSGFMYALPKAEGIAKLVRTDQAGSRFFHKEALKILSALDEAYDKERGNSPMTAHVLGEAFDRARTLYLPELQLLFYGACARWFQRAGQKELFRMAADEYRGLSGKLTGHTNFDSLRLHLSSNVDVDSQFNTSKLLTDFSFSAPGRMERVTKLAASLGSSTLKYWLSSFRGVEHLDHKSTQQEAGRILRHFCSSAKGLAMKTTQIVALLEGIFGPDAAKEMASVGDHSDAFMSIELVQRIFKAEIGRSIGEVFLHFGETPVSSASIGQVHRAVLRDGRVVAVKIQYPNIDRQMKTQLQAGRLIGVLLRSRFPNLNFKTLLEEIAKYTISEVDYKQELQNQERMREVLADHPNIVIAEPIRELSSRKVLTSDFLDGVNIKSFCSKASQAERNKAGSTLHHALFAAAYRHGFAYCDAHPQNFIFMQGGKVGLVDFACCYGMPLPGFTHQLDSYRLLVGELNMSYAELLERDGIIPSAESFDADHMMPIIMKCSEPWITPGQYRFDTNIVQALAQLIKEFHIARIPEGSIPYFRFIMGLTSILSSLGAEFDAFESFWQSARNLERRAAG